MSKLEDFVIMILTVPLVALVLKYLLKLPYLKSLIYSFIVAIATFLMAFIIIPYLSELFLKIIKILKKK